MDKPTYEKFKRYCISKNYGTDEYIKSLYDYLDERKWKKANGGEPVNWMILTDANFGVFNAKGKFSRAIREKLAEKSENFDPVEPFPDNGMNYVAYTDGSCDNHSKYKAGGSAYIVLKDGEIVKMKNHGRLQTTNNRMELLAIISAAKSCPDGAYLDIYTDSQYCILVLGKSTPQMKNPDLYELYKKCSAHLAGVRFHWVKGHNGDKYNEMVDNLAYGAYCDICEQYNIEKSKRH